MEQISEITAMFYFLWKQVLKSDTRIEGVYHLFNIFKVRTSYAAPKHCTDIELKELAEISSVIYFHMGLFEFGLYWESVTPWRLRFC